MHPQDLIKAGRLTDALVSLQNLVRTDPANAKYRVFLFQLLSVMGQWGRALTQLNVVGELDADALPMVRTYREAILCEALRADIFAGKRAPLIFGEPEDWLGLLVEALRLDAIGREANAAHAAELRAHAFEAAPASSGSIDGAAFAWLADADVRLAPVLEAVVNGRYCWIPFGALAKVHVEAPEDLRDFVWMPAQLEFPNGGSSVALIPTRYCGVIDAAPGAELLARATAWDELSPDGPLGAQYAGRGQRLFTTSANEIGLLELRELEIAAPAGDAEAAAAAAGPASG